MRITNVAIIGGGTGPSVILEGLRDIHNFGLTAIVAMSDSGGSTRGWRQWYGLRPPGDIRNNMAPLIPDPIIEDLFQFRFKDNDDSENRPAVAGHPVGNMLLSALEIIYKNRFIPALDKLHDLLGIQKNHRVFPVTTDNINLRAEYADGKIISGEADIDVPKIAVKLPIKKISLVPETARICDESACAIEKADLIIFAPGSLFTSSIATILPHGVKECLQESKGKIIYVCNMMTQPGQTSAPEFGVESDPLMAKYHVQTLEEYAGINFDHIFFNTTRPEKTLLAKYAADCCYPIKWDLDHPSISGDFLCEDAQKAGLIRHDSAKLIRSIMEII